MKSKSEAQFKWQFRVPKNPVKVKRPPREECPDHPLKPTHIVTSEIKSTNPLLKKKIVDDKNFTDPLSLLGEASDPLSLMAAENALDLDIQTPVKEHDPEFCLRPWAEQRASILNKYTTSQKLSMTSSYLPGLEKGVKSHHSCVVQHRLEQLDDFEEGSVKEVSQLTQQQYVDSINQLNKELVQAWNHDHRVKALKITIQCSKLLVNTSVLQFYPSKFVLVTDILDIFGSLVYERLRSKAEYKPVGSKIGGLPENFTADMVGEGAKETCRNWFYKIASIRELVPRLYVEAAILKSYSFLTNREFSQALTRLTQMVRGIGDPLVALYARCYLCRVGMSIPNIDRQFLKDNFYDFLSVYDQLFSSYVKNELSRQKVEMTSYLGIYTPALDWILQGLSHRAPNELLDNIVQACTCKENNGLLLNSIMANFNPTYIASRAEYFINLVSIPSEGIPTWTLLNTLGECIQHHLVENPVAIFDKAWKLISKLSNSAHFIACAHVWVLFIVKNFSHVQINRFLGDVIAHIGPDGKNYSQVLQNIITTIVTNISDLQSIFLMDKLLPALDLFDTETSKVVVSRKILEVCATKPNFVCSDPVTTGALLFVAKILHDSVNALTVDDEKKQIGVLISRLIRQINFGMDFEKQLNFYVDARGMFTHIDSILATLVFCVNNLAHETGRIVKSHHTKKTGSFVRACAAYCYITIPSLSSETTKLLLYLLTAQVALFNQCLGQADACIKAALTLCVELPPTIEENGKTRSTESFFSEYVCKMLSTLIVVPDCPDQGAVYLTRGLINMMSHYTNEQNAGLIVGLFLKVIDMLSTCAQPQYPYRIKNVDSNDVFYGSDPKFINELNKMCTVIVNEVLSFLKILGANNYYNKQAKLAFELFVRVVLHSDLEVPEMATLAQNLWNLSHRHGSLDSKLVAATVEYLKKSSSFTNSSVHKELISKLG